MPLKASNTGFSLLEVMLAVVVSLGTLGGIAKAFEVFRHARDKHGRAIELETVRSLVRGKVVCGAKCSDVMASVPPRYGDVHLRVDCRDWFDGFKVAARYKDETDYEPLFEIGGGDLCAYRNSSCMGSCHNRGVLLERGFFSPPIAGIDHDLTHQLDHAEVGFKCPPNTKTIGVDFALGRLICEEPTAAAAVEKCAEMQTFAPSPNARLKVTLRGREPCTEYSQVRALRAVVDGIVQVKLADGFMPAPGDEFDVVVSFTAMSGRFAHQDDRVVLPEGTFRIAYEGKRVVLTDFLPVQSPSH